MAWVPTLHHGHSRICCSCPPLALSQNIQQTCTIQLSNKTLAIMGLGSPTLLMITFRSRRHTTNSNALLKSSCVEPSTISYGGCTHSVRIPTAVSKQTDTRVTSSGNQSCTWEDPSVKMTACTAIPKSTAFPGRHSDVPRCAKNVGAVHSLMTIPLSACCLFPSSCHSPVLPPFSQNVRLSLVTIRSRTLYSFPRPFNFTPISSPNFSALQIASLLILLFRFSSHCSRIPFRSPISKSSPPFLVNPSCFPDAPPIFQTFWIPASPLPFLSCLIVPPTLLSSPLAVAFLLLVPFLSWFPTQSLVPIPFSLCVSLFRLASSSPLMHPGLHNPNPHS